MTVRRKTGRHYAARRPKRVLKTHPGRNDIGQYAPRKVWPSVAIPKIEEPRVKVQCISRAGIERRIHEWDKDGKCVFCDTEGEVG